MSKISLKGIASKMSASQMKNVTGGDGSGSGIPCPNPCPPGVIPCPPYTEIVFCDPGVPRP